MEFLHSLPKSQNYSIRIFSPKERSFFSSEFGYNIVKMFSVSTGDYIFWLEGDDYWVDRRKVSKQVQFLDKNKDISFCFHAYEQVHLDGCRDSTFTYPNNFRRGYTIFELQSFQYAYILLGTCCIRNYKFDWDPEAYISRNADMFYPCVFSQSGGATFLNDVLPHAYRVHPGGSWSGEDPQKKLVRKFMTCALMLHSLARRDIIRALPTLIKSRFVPLMNALFR